MMAIRNEDAARPPLRHCIMASLRRDLKNFCSAPSTRPHASRGWLTHERPAWAQPTNSHQMEPDRKSPRLVIDTATNIMNIGVWTGEKLIDKSEDTGPKQTEKILPAISSLLEEAALRTSDLESIVYSSGPGSFTGLRVGFAVAQGIAIAKGTPLIGIPTLDAIASLANDGKTYVLAAMDARMSELFWAWYKRGGGEPLNGYHVGSPETIENTIPDGLDPASAMGVGNAYSLSLNLPVEGRDMMPKASTYLELSWEKERTPQDVATASLLYVRDKVALTQKEQISKFGDKASNMSGTARRQHRGEP